MSLGGFRESALVVGKVPLALDVDTREAKYPSLSVARPSTPDKRITGDGEWKERRIAESLPRATRLCKRSYPSR